MKIESFGTVITLARADGTGVADRWAKQYEDGRYPDKTAITAKLFALGSAPSAADVAAVIGNKSWTHPTCTICRKEPEVALRVAGEYSDNEEFVCAECMTLALEVMKR